MISKPTIARIIETARIEEVVGDFLTLKKRGVNYIARCPFHNEKTPSFNVNPVRNIYKCFGCGKGGDSVSFVMEHEKMTYPEALRYLAKKYNIEIEEIYDRNIEEEKKLENERESLFVANAYAQKYFTETLLNSDEGKSIGLSYFKERGLSDEIIQKFQLGYAHENRNAFTDTAIREGYNLDYLVKTGLTIRPEDNPEKIYDRFAGRVMFPIHNITGRVIGFGGRALKKEAKAKYVNSPESEIYHKSNVLYGLSVSRKVISTEDNCFLVEGYMDVISLHQSGIENVVASSGTSLTVEQIRLIKRYTNNITIMYDGDAAGIKASFRGIDMILEEGLNVRVVLFPEGHDPDSFSRKHSETELKNFIEENKTDFIRFKTQLLYSETQNDPIKKATLIQEIVNSIALMPNSITRTVFIQECSKIMKMDEQALLTELNKVLRKRYAKNSNELPIEDIIDLDNPPVPQPIDTNLNTGEAQEKEVIRFLLSYGQSVVSIEDQEKENEEIKTVIYNLSIAELIIESIMMDNLHFNNEVYQNIFDEFVSHFKNGNILSIEHFIHHTNSKISTTAIDLTTFRYTVSDWKGKHDITVPTEQDDLKTSTERVIYALQIRKIPSMITKIMSEIQNPENISTEEEFVQLIRQKKLLDEARNVIAKRTGGWVML